jgi:hypothetical protein
MNHSFLSTSKCQFDFFYYCHTDYTKRIVNRLKFKGVLKNKSSLTERGGHGISLVGEARAISLIGEP